jgi:hypothetical protein
MMRAPFFAPSNQDEGDRLHSGRVLVVGWAPDRQRELAAVRFGRHHLSTSEELGLHGHGPAAHTGVLRLRRTDATSQALPVRRDQPGATSQARPVRQSCEVATLATSPEILATWPEILATSCYSKISFLAAKQFPAFQILASSNMLANTLPVELWLQGAVRRCQRGKSLCKLRVCDQVLGAGTYHT